MSFNPAVSVIIPVYNAKPYIEDAISSILTQTLASLELIIIDDGSTDGSDAVCERLSRLDSRINYIKKRNEGIAITLNYGIKLAKGEFIARMDADDIALPTRLEEQVGYLRANDNVALISCAYVTFGSEAVIHSTVIHPTNPQIIKLLLCYCSPICHPGVMARAEVLRSYSYRENIAAEDHELWCRMADSNVLANVSTVLLKYRKSGTSLSKKKLASIRIDTLRNGFKFFLRNKSVISKIPWREVRRHKRLFPNLRWLPAYVYRLLSSI